MEAAGGYCDEKNWCMYVAHQLSISPELGSFDLRRVYLCSLQEWWSCGLKISILLRHKINPSSPGHVGLWMLLISHLLTWDAGEDILLRENISEGDWLLAAWKHPFLLLLQILVEKIFFCTQKCLHIGVSGTTEVYWVCIRVPLPTWLSFKNLPRLLYWARPRFSVLNLEFIFFIQGLNTCWIQLDLQETYLHWQHNLEFT